MEGERIGKALARIQAAAARIEQAATRPVPAGDPDLERRHAALSSEAGAALAELDRLIAGLEG